MKKLLAVMLLMAMVLSLSACGEGKTENSSGNSEEFVIEHKYCDFLADMLCLLYNGTNIAVPCPFHKNKKDTAGITVIPSAVFSGLF